MILRVSAAGWPPGWADVVLLEGVHAQVVLVAPRREHQQDLVRRDLTREHCGSGREIGTLEQDSKNQTPPESEVYCAWNTT